MASYKIQWIEVIANLVFLTQDGLLVWGAGELFNSIGKQSDERIESVFYTTYKGKKLRLYKRTYKAYRNDITSTPYMADEVVLEIVADNGLTLWTFPKVDVTRDLLEAVQYEVSGANVFLVDMLKV
ncbi:MAG: hypothetical protein ACPGWR_31155 [Ardenticatenaceae bacterium]